MDRRARYPSLQDRHVLISGGASGIGATLVRDFAAQGAQVSFIDIAADDAARLLAQLRGDGLERVEFLRCDITDVAALQASIGNAAARHGAVDVLINNAANDTRLGLMELDVTKWDASLAVNLRHQVFAIQAVVPGMQRRGAGSIINLGSISWMVRSTGMPAYTASKAGIHGLTRPLARELGPHGIRVNTILPGAVFTERQLRLWLTPEMRAQIARGQCLPGELQADDVSAMALFLAADDSRMCTGQDFIVDAGMA